MHYPHKVFSNCLEFLLTRTAKLVKKNILLFSTKRISNVYCYFIPLHGLHSNTPGFFFIASIVETWNYGCPMCVCEFCGALNWYEKRT
jgi:hypothetical protein